MIVWAELFLFCLQSLSNLISLQFCIQGSHEAVLKSVGEEEHEDRSVPRSQTYYVTRHLGALIFD